MKTSRKPSTKQKRQHAEQKAVLSLSPEHLEMLQGHVSSSIESYLFPVEDGLDDAGLISAWEAQRATYVARSMASPCYRSRKDAEFDVRFVDSQVELLKALIEQEPSVAVRFTPEQFKRLQSGAKVFGASPEDLCIAGALSQLDCYRIPRKKAIFATQCLVEAYAKGRETFLQPEHGTDKPVQFVRDGVRYDEGTGTLTVTDGLNRKLRELSTISGRGIREAIVASAEALLSMDSRKPKGR